jgi:molecular chaperone HscB
VFGLLGLPARFDLDPSVIEAAFFERSKELHPDRFASAPAAERVVALSRARALNDAYKLLKNPITRAEHLLARAGVTIGDNEQLPPETLLELMEQREELAEACAARQAAEIERLRAAMAARRAAAVNAMPALFERAHLAPIKNLLMSVRYMDRYLEQCDAVLDED